MARLREPSRAKSRIGHVRFRRLSSIRPSPENDQLYRPVNPLDPAIRSLAKSIAEHGVLEPMVVTADGYILSGHRRYAAARLAGLSRVPCRTERIRRCDDLDEFVRRLREHNRQREKTLDERFREELVSTDPDTAYATLRAERRARSRLEVAGMTIVGNKTRSTISQAKRPMLEAIGLILEERRDFWPLSDRQIHYALLNDPPLIHASKPASRYANTLRSYKALTELLTRGRLAGIIPFQAIADETRPVVTWDVHAGPSTFIRCSLDNMFKGYWRDLMQSQPNHIEILGEKNTLRSIVEPVASEYCIPLTTGRGYCSLPPRHAMAQRYRRSGRDQLVLLILTDHDPDGEEIAQSFARSMRDDFDIDSIHVIKAALTAEQVTRFRLPPGMKAKRTSAQYGKFVEQHGALAYELEALPPAVLQQVLREAIDSVIDLQAFDHEVQTERLDAAHLNSLRKVACEALRSVDTHGDRP